MGVAFMFLVCTNQFPGRGAKQVELFSIFSLSVTITQSSTGRDICVRVNFKSIKWKIGKIREIIKYIIFGPILK